jgi:HD-GYP domain-containing protein (c-di-GMP phosphodiesterase class II)
LLKASPAVADVMRMGTRIISVCDVFQVITPEPAGLREEPGGDAGAQFDPAAVKAFKANLDARPALPQAAA